MQIPSKRLPSGVMSPCFPNTDRTEGRGAREHARPPHLRTGALRAKRQARTVDSMIVVQLHNVMDEVRQVRPVEFVVSITSSPRA